MTRDAASSPRAYHKGITICIYVVAVLSEGLQDDTACALWRPVTREKASRKEVRPIVCLCVGVNCTMREKVQGERERD